MKTPYFKYITVVAILLVAAFVIFRALAPTPTSTQAVTGHLYIGTREGNTCAFELKKQTVHKESHNLYSNFPNCTNSMPDAIWLENTVSATTIRIRAFTMYKDPFENMYAGWSSENPCISQIWGGTFQYWADLKTVGATRETLKFSLDDIMTAAPYQVIVPGVVLTAKGESAQQPPFGRPAMFACIHIEPST